ncbi:MAG: 50S ribosomal protein L13 [Thaumarchaeota archaeon]|nr:50S ribosomal protein L13 [Candidatus Calditenuaceae archaeon]MDW8187175.1 50S ribosomal protein L13 [Nitrososphaerota archaeon]
MRGLEELVVIDGSGHRFGRLASRVAKMLLEGKRVVVLNADRIVITGTKSAALERYQKLLDRKWYSSIEKVQISNPRRPDRVFWQAVKRMLPKKKALGEEALSRLRVYVGIPSEFAKCRTLRIPDAEHRSNISRSGKLVKSITLGELLVLIGGRVTAQGSPEGPE